MTDWREGRLINNDFDMARTRTVIETITCDVCGKSIRRGSPTSIGFGADRWELDLCDKDLAALQKQIAQITSNARRSTIRRSVRQTEDEWTYLESKGFTRHRGRKSAEELAALRNR